MFSHRYFSIVALISLLCLNVIQAQNKKNDLIISIKNQLGEVIVDAEVYLSQSDQKTIKLKTDKQGFVRFRNLADGTYGIKVTADGFND